MTHDSFVERPQESSAVPPVETKPSADFSAKDAAEVCKRVNNAQELAPLLEKAAAETTIFGNANRHGDHLRSIRIRITDELRAALALLEETK